MLLPVLRQGRTGVISQLRAEEDAWPSGSHEAVDVLVSATLAERCGRSRLDHVFDAEGSGKHRESVQEQEDEEGSWHCVVLWIEQGDVEAKGGDGCKDRQLCRIRWVAFIYSRRSSQVPLGVAAWHGKWKTSLLVENVQHVVLLSGSGATAPTSKLLARVKISASLS